MPKILITKTLKEIAKLQGKQIGKDYIELLDRIIYNQIVSKVAAVKQKRLTHHDII